MTSLLFFAVAALGGIGAVARFLADAGMRRVIRTTLPIPIALINITGSFALGVVTALAATAVLDADLAIVLGAGFLGGYTTFSTASLDTVTLVRAGRFGEALAIGLGTLVASVAAAGLGLALGYALAR
ncbi:fluoride efflux transporter CrcB [Marisediminicola sp. LYQ85]|uniref:fluoride efflux transporter CrcB n=1 Tax=Marisediminicola sp. LYQ85 TaxID=3391062 RepID=UPI0039831B2B